MSGAIAKVCAAIEHDDVGVHLDADEMREVIDALDGAEIEAGSQRARADAAEAQLARLRAIVEGRTVPPTDAEITVHWRAGGAWLVDRTVITDPGEARRQAIVGIAVTWVALDGTLRGGVPCAWPVPA